MCGTTARPGRTAKAGRHVARFTELRPLFDNTGSAANRAGEPPRRQREVETNMPNVINTAAFFATLYAAVLLMKFA
jgi:hypothetical protein